MTTRRTHGPDGGPATLTVAGLALGTARYMSPEQACGEEVEAPSDLFSLGIMLYELATGVHPFAATSDLALIGAIITRDPVPPARLRPELPSELSDLVLAMLEKAPARRPTADDLSRALGAMTSGARARVEAGPAPAAPEQHVVGRRSELALLRSAMDAVQAGRGSVVSVAGEAGMGKSTLVEAFLTPLRGPGPSAIVARGRCSERLAGGEAYLPLLDALDDLLRADTGDITARTLRAFAPGWSQLVSPSADASPPPPPDRLKRELAGFFLELARTRAVVLFLDDLHWADVPTVDFLAYLAPRLAGVSMLVVVTYRTSEMLTARHPFVSLERDLLARGLGRVVPLAELSLADAAEYVRRVFAGHRFPDEFVELLHTKTGGSPLFLVDVLRYLREEAVVQREGDGWGLAAGLPDIERELPASIRSMIQRKMDQLDDQQRRVLAAASVQGYEFDSAAVAAALGAEPADVEEWLDTLETVHAFVRRVDEREMPSGALSVRYRFAHLLYQNASYASLPPTRRAHLSGALARAIVALYADRSIEIAADLALLFENARDFAAAARHFTVAVRRAGAVYANEEAVAYARRGLALTARLPDGPERWELEVGLLIPLSFALRLLRGYANEEAAECVRQARARCGQLGDVPALGVVLYYIAIFYLVGAELETARAMGAEVVRFGESTGDEMSVMAGRAMVAFATFHLGDVPRAHELFEQVIAEHAALDPRACAARYGSDSRAFARAETIRTLWLLDREEDALARARDALAAAQAQPTIHVDLAFALVMHAFLAQFRGDPDDALHWAELCIAYCNEHGIAQEREWATPIYGWALVRRGRVDEGLAVIDASVAAERAMGARLVMPYVHALRADALLFTGRIDEARDALAEGALVMEATGQRFYEAEQLRLAGEVCAAEASVAGRTELLHEAERHFRQAAEVAARQGISAFRRRAEASLARRSWVAGR
jgi:predicted ATPase